MRITLQKSIGFRVLGAMPYTGYTLIDMRTLVHGCTFDDFLFSPQLGVLARRDPSRVDLSCALTHQIKLSRPFVSANMDTVTRAPMAVLVAEEGGIGIIRPGMQDR